MTMKTLFLTMTIVGLLLMPRLLRAADVPMVAYLYSTNRPNMDQAHDKTFEELGWPSHKWQNLYVGRLAENLDGYDMVIGSVLYNLANPQDFKVYRSQWLGFLERGGVIVVSGPQDTVAQWDWIPDLGADFHFTLKTFKAFQKRSDWTNPDAELNFGPVSAAWAQFSSWSPKWTVTNHNANGKPIVLYQEVGKGLIVVATTYQSMFTRPQDLAKIWSFARRGTEQSPLQITKRSWGKKAFGPSKVDFTVRNRSDQPIDLRAVLRLFNYANPPASQTRRAHLDARGEADISLPYSIVSGDNEVSLVLDSADGRAPLRTGTRYVMLDVAGRMKALDSLLGEVQSQLDKLKDWPGEIVAPVARAHESLVAVSAAFKEEFTGADVDFQGLHDRTVAAANEARALRARLATWSNLAVIPAADQRMLVFKSSLLEKVFRDRAWAGPVAVVNDVELAGNEHESFQLVVLPLQGRLENVRVTCSELKSRAGAVIRDVQVRPVADLHLRIKGMTGWYPDVLLTVDRFDVCGDSVARSVWITVHAPAGTPAGLYSGTVTLNADGAPSVEMPVTVKVWDFSVPHQRNLPTQFNCRANCLANLYFGKKAFLQYWKYLSASAYHRFIEYLLKYRIAAHPYDDFQGQSKSAIPYLPEEMLDTPWEDPSDEARWKDGAVSSLDFTDFDKHMQLLLDHGNDFVTAGYMHHYRLEGEGVTRGKYWRSFLPKMYRHLKEKGWDKKAFLYGLDEPQPEKGHLPRVQAQYDLVKELCPSVKYLLPYEKPDVAPAPDDPSYADIWVPHLGLFSKQLSAERTVFRQSVWAYTVPGFGTHLSTHEYRSLFWRVWRDRCQGFLYYATAFFEAGSNWDVGENDLNPDGSPKETFLPEGRNGMNFLIYPVSGDPEDGPNASIRLESIRDGLEDWEYFYMLSNLIEQSAEKDSGQVKAAVALLRQVDAGTGRVVPSTSPAAKLTPELEAPAALRLERKTVAEMIERLRGGR